MQGRKSNIPTVCAGLLLHPLSHSSLGLFLQLPPPHTPLFYFCFILSLFCFYFGCFSLCSPYCENDVKKGKEIWAHCDSVGLEEYQGAGGEPRAVPSLGWDEPTLPLAITKGASGASHGWPRGGAVAPRGPAARPAPAAGAGLGWMEREKDGGRRDGGRKGGGKRRGGREGAALYKFLNFMAALQQRNVHSICWEVSPANMQRGILSTGWNGAVNIY